MVEKDRRTQRELERTQKSKERVGGTRNESRGRVRERVKFVVEAERRKRTVRVGRYLERRKRTRKKREKRRRTEKSDEKRGERVDEEACERETRRC